MNELALFAGAGGGILGGHLLGWRTVCGVEWNAYAASVLLSRQNDGCLPPFPIWDDVQTFDGRPWRGIVDVVSGGFPCQDISCAGKGAGITGARSGMWAHMARIIGEVRPRYAFIENSPMLSTRGLDTVLCDLAKMGYDAEWGCISAADCGAPHKRERIWIVAYSNSAQCKRRGISSRVFTQNTDISSASADKKMANTTSIGQPGPRQYIESICAAKDRNRETGKSVSISINREWPVEPDVGRVANGVAARVDRLTAIGNGQVPRVAAMAWRILTHNHSRNGLR
jgi:DNA (cytosine-5)-methyltransferase 1